ncbi:MAG: cyclic nucleotide-binding domain-containing protein [Nitrospirae bacterium]|nr:cyclic nucleotide-binding domain-containing protein [Nitrospirota bacterium]
MIETAKIFKELDDNERELIKGIIEFKDFKAGETVYMEGKEGDSLNIIVKGSVKICKTTPEGELFCLTSLRAGEKFGIMSFLDGSKHDATIVTEEDTQLMVIKKSDFDNFAKSNALIAIKILRGLSIHLATILRKMNAQFMDMSHYMFGAGKR